MATDWNRLTVVDLKQELKRRQLPITGKKADLVERLTQAETAEHEAAPGESADSTSQPNHASPDNHDAAPPTETLPEENGNLTLQSQTQNPPEIVENEVDPEVTSPPEEEPTPEVKGDTEEIPTPPQEPEKDYTSAEAMAAETALDDKKDNPMLDQTESTAPELSPELSRDARGRKRRSRTPPPSDDETSRKRPRNEEDGVDGDQNLNGVPLPQEEVLPLDDDLASKDISYARIRAEISTELPHDQEAVMKDEETQEPMTKDEGIKDEKDEDLVDVKKDHGTDLPNEDGMIIDDAGENTQRLGSDDQYPNVGKDAMDEDSKDVTPSIHPATSALYIRNLMRPLRDTVLREYLVDLATPRGKSSDPEIIVKFYLDPIRTHAFVQFNSLTAAARARVLIHGKTWPNERNRKELWADFIPPEKIEDWIEKERTDASKSKVYRWEVAYETDEDGKLTAELVNAADPEYAARSAMRQAPVPTVAIPTGPRRFPGVEGAPLGPRGRGQFRDFTAGGDFKFTEAGPRLPYKPVPEEVAQRRLDNMRSYYTTDRRRDMGREDEINRYTFEDVDSFVDRGVEVFIGIRPPHREQERRRGGNGGSNWPPRDRWGPPPSRPRGDRYIGGGRDEPRWDAPARSRLDGAPLPTFGGGSGFRSDRRGPRRDNFRSGRF